MTSHLVMSAARECRYGRNENAKLRAGFREDSLTIVQWLLRQA
jgi:hypothetical protein